MTRAEAMEYLEIERTDYDMAVYNDSPMKEALNMAIEALEQIKAIEGIIDVSNITIQEDVLKYKMIVDVVKGG